jgi:hypothetical protein
MKNIQKIITTLLFIIVIAIFASIYLKDQNKIANLLLSTEDSAEIKSNSNSVNNNQQESKQSDIAHFVYFSGLRCPHCANVDPILFKEKIRKNNILIVEYEIHENRDNGALLFPFHEKYKIPLGVPLLIATADSKDMFVGDQPILDNIDEAMQKFSGNKLILLSQEEKFNNIDLQKTKGSPAIWYKNRLAKKIAYQDTANKERDNQAIMEEIKMFILHGIMPNGALQAQQKNVTISGSEIKFNNAFTHKGWLLYFD